ncbi:MAG: TerC family protein [Syntrophomonadaceae bacterium]|nr:TerC family protein [Syntrophomonadaceae bacterium]
MRDLATPMFWFGVFSIILIDLVLSGDNALLIALACRNLPSRLQTRGIIYGTLGAIGLRVLFASIMVYLLMIPYLKAVGGLMLFWIAVKLLLQEGAEEHEVEAPERLWAAVKTIIVADALMSLDNIIAIAGASQGKPALLWFGLLVSIPLVVFGSRLLLVLMSRFSWIITLGAAVLGWTAGHMIVTDQKISQYLGNILESPFLLKGSLIPLLGAVGVVAASMVLKKHRPGLDSGS